MQVQRFFHKTKTAMLVLYLAMTGFLLGGLVVVASNQMARR